jgi:hypothetical protein
VSLSREHWEVLEYTNSLFTRWALRGNRYLFKHMEPSLEIPLYIVAEERRVAQITHSQPILIQVPPLPRRPSKCPTSQQSVKSHEW